MKLKLLSAIVIFLVIFQGFIPTSSAAGAAETSPDKTINIVTADNRPLSVDRLLYMACKEIGYKAVLTCDTIQSGCAAANNGEKAGIISSLPDMEETYSSLIRVPVEIEQTNFCAFVRSDSNIVINSWEDLGKYSVGILTNRQYILEKIPAGASISEHETNNLVLEGLVLGEYDVAVLTEKTHEKLSPRTDIKIAGQLDSLVEYLYLHKNYGYLIPALTDTLNAMFADGLADQILNDLPTPEINQKKTILYIVSGNTEVGRETEFYTTLHQSFDSDTSVEIYAISLNSRRFSRDPNRLSYIADLLRQDCASRNIAAVIVSGDDAIEFLINYYYLFFRNVPVLFYSVSNQYETIIQGYEDYFTGIVEVLEAYETVSTALELFEGTKNLYVVNDYMTEGSVYRAAIQKQLEPLADRINIEYNEDTDIESMLAVIREQPEDGMVLVGSYFTDRNGQYFPLGEMKRLMEINCGVPVFSLHSTALEYNAVGGKCLDYKKCGEIVVNLLMDILNGTNIADIPVVSDPALYSQWVFDKTKMDMLGISERALPAGAMVINRVISIWESDPRFVITLVLLFVAGIAAVAGISFLFVSRHKIAQSEMQNEQLRTARQSLQTVLDSLPISVRITDSQTATILYANNACLKMFGFDKSKDLYKYSLYDIIPSVQSDGEDSREKINSLLKSNELMSKEVEYLTATGDKIDTRVTVCSIDYAGIASRLAIVADLSQERESERIRQSLQTVLDMLPIAIRILNIETTKLTYANKAAAEMFEFPNAKEAYGRLSHTFIAEPQPDGLSSFDVLEKIKPTSMEPVSTEIVLQKPNGKQFDAVITACLIDYNGEKSSLGVIQDLTQEKEYQRMLAGIAEKEREANQLKSRFLVNMSHEIRTPMNIIMGLTEIEIHKDLPAGTKDIYKKINISAKNLLAIINDILDLSKIEANKVELYEDEFELEEVLNSALLVASPRLDGKHVEFVLNEALELPRFIVGDRTKLWQILKNFLDNAAKYTESGRIVLTVFIDSEHSDDETAMIKFIIEDTGIGMDEEQMNRIFMPYEQIYNDAQKKYSGTGLGMVISKHLCELMGGSLLIQSRPGAGTIIDLGIPFRHSKNNAAELRSINPQALAGINVLAVDDEKISLDIMERLLTSSGANCMTAQSGTEAMRIILERRDKGEYFDIILLDYMMEGLTGLETARQINISLSKAPKLLMVTAYQKLLIKSELEKNGILDVIEKPFVPSHFINKLCVALDLIPNTAEEHEVFTRFKDASVLLCEDYRLNQEVASGMLAQFGVETTIAEDGSQGIELLNSGMTFDLILMDLHMPVMDGFEATRIIRADSRFDSIPIISLTADAMKEAVDECLKMGMNDHMAKPIEFDSLHRTLKKWLPESKRVLCDEILSSAINQMNDVLARFDGNQERYEKALLEFTQLLPDVWQDFEGAVKDHEKTRKFVHKLKGAAGTLGETAIYKHASDFESSLRIMQPDAALYGELINICNIVKNRIIEQTKDLNAASMESGTIKEFTELLNALRAALQEYDPKASSGVLKSLKEKVWPSADEMKLSKLYELTEKYEFDSAVAILGDIMEAINE